MADIDMDLREQIKHYEQMLAAADELIEALGVLAGDDCPSLLDVARYEAADAAYARLKATEVWG